MTAARRDLLGRRFVTDFTVVAVMLDGEVHPETNQREAVLLMYGEHYRISVEELETLVENGIVAEAPRARPPEGRES